MEKFVEQRYFSRSPDKFYVKYNFYNLSHLICLFRSSHLMVFCQKAVFKNFAKFSGKDLWWSLFLIKLQASILQLYLKRDSNTSFFCKFYDIFKTSCSHRTCPVAACVYFLLDGLYFSLQPIIHVTN